jgi:hypothetical protein
MVNIYSLYVTRSKAERHYFYKLLEHIKKGSFNLFTLVHLDFRYDAVYQNMKYNNKLITAFVYTFGKDVSLEKINIYNLEDLKKLFKKNNNSDKNVFVYSGHSDGINLKKSKIEILRIQDFCEIINNTLGGEKADLIIYDCCLCGNINCLSVSRNYTKYVIAATSYWSYMSVLMTNAIYTDLNIIDYCKSIVSETVNLENGGNKKEIYYTSFVIYSMNKDLDILIDFVLKNKHLINKKQNNVINNYYYKSIDCSFKKINDLLNKIVIYQRFKKNKCYSRKLSNKANHGIPTKMMVITRNPSKNGIPTEGDIFYI